MIGIKGMRLTAQARSNNPLERIAAYAGIAAAVDATNMQAIVDQTAYTALAQRKGPMDLLQALGYTELEHAEKRHDFREDIREVLDLIIQAWHINRPLETGGQMTFPVVSDCGWKGRLIFQQDEMGSCLDNLTDQSFEVNVEATGRTDSPDITISDVVVDVGSKPSS